jgi:hypothetical protein
VTAVAETSLLTAVISDYPSSAGEREASDGYIRKTECLVNTVAEN